MIKLNKPKRRWFSALARPLARQQKPRRCGTKKYQRWYPKRAHRKRQLSARTRTASALHSPIARLARVGPSRVCGFVLQVRLCLERAYYMSVLIVHSYKPPRHNQILHMTRSGFTPKPPPGPPQPPPQPGPGGGGSVGCDVSEYSGYV